MSCRKPLHLIQVLFYFYFSQLYLLLSSSHDMLFLCVVARFRISKAQIIYTWDEISDYSHMADVERTDNSEIVCFILVFIPFFFSTIK